MYGCMYVCMCLYIYIYIPIYGQASRLIRRIARGERAVVVVFVLGFLAGCGLCFRCCYRDQANALMAGSAAMEMVQLHGSNKISKAAWWNYHDVLHKRVSDLAMEYLCAKWRPLPPASKIALQNLYGTSWLRDSPYVIWMDAWILLPLPQRSSYIQHTYDVDEIFAGAMVNAAYAVCIGQAAGLEAMD